MNPMPIEQAALWQMIRENPHDDAPRLIYSDWLEEHDQAERAEFIRRHIADYHAIHDGLTDEATLLNRVACRKLFQDHQLEWWNPAHREIEYFPFSRGFPSPKFIYSTYPKSFQSFRKLAGEYIWNVPEWRMIRGGPFSPTNIRYDASHVNYRSIVSHEFNDQIYPSTQFINYLNSPNLLNLWSISLGMTGDLTEYLKILFESPMPTLLRELSIGSQQNIISYVFGQSRSVSFDASEFGSLADNKCLSNLHSLRIAGSAIQDNGLRQIDRIIPFKKLSKLNLQGNQISAESIQCFINDEEPKLIGLNLAQNHIGNEGAIRLARSPSMSRLQFLNLKQNQIGSEGLRALLDSPILKRTTYCLVNDNPGLADPEIEEGFREWQTFAKAYIA